MPEGIQVSAISPTGYGQEIVLQIRNSRTLKLDGQQVALSHLSDSLQIQWKNQSEKKVLVQPSLDVDFSDVVKAMDACRAAGAKITLTTPAE